MTQKIKYKITGNTFKRSPKIKKAGGIWDPIKKYWVAELYETDSLFRYTDLNFVRFAQTSNKSATTLCPKCGTHCFGDCQE